MKCICNGPLCQCEAAGVVRDGHGVSVSSMTMDAAPQRPFGIVSDEELQMLRDRRDAARAEYIADMALAHQRPADYRPSIPTVPSVTKDGRDVSTLNDSERARHEMIHRMQYAHLESRA